ncbi:hypothetical protein FE257_007502 [Aspergillus nanangensis]|uniref:ABC multidrug transporter n=1 Tax=Aspergillus nanangensis TaxID=2582783 RepID=A0AAD4CME4_ASPNN|nr:hypothetical protein FE257_007502 [Aspergillus nanangensis]
MVRGAIISIVYEKASNLNGQDADTATSLTLMSADVERIVQGWQTMHDIWANIIQIGLAVFLLEQQLGISCMVPVGVAIVALLGSFISLSLVIPRQSMWLEAIERRTLSTTSMLASIKEIKMLGLGTFFMTLVHKMRTDELDISKRFRTLLVWNMAFAWLTRIFAPIFTFATFVAISHKSGNDTALNTTNTFTSMSLFTLLADPLLSLVMALMSFIGSVGSFGRIQEYIQKEDHEDFRRKTLKPTYDLFQRSEKAIFSKPEVLTDGSSSSTNLSHRSTTPPPHPFRLLAIENGTFGWDSGKEPQLKDLSVAVSRGTFVMLLGPSGCGKSTLLKTILGEVPCLGGCISISSRSIAYCDQSPWHMNGTIKDGIIGMSGLDEEWYTIVVRACALDEDLRQLPRDDQTVIGNKGISISGGQSQRIALARAIYARKEVILLDDVLSSLDTVTEDYIFHHLLGVHGILRSIGSTVILASSSVKRAPYSDLVVALDTNGRVMEQGSFQDLNSTGGYVSSFALGAPQWEFEESRPSTPERDNIRRGPEKEPDEPMNETPGHGGDMTIYLYYARSIGWVATLVFMMAITSFVFCISFPSLWVKWWASSNEAEPGTHTSYYLGIYGMLGGIGMISLIVGCWQMFITMVPKSGEFFHREMLITVLSQDLQLIDMELPIAAINTFVMLVLCICQLVFMGMASKYAAISFPLVIITIFFIQKVYLRTSRQLRLLDLEAKAPLYSHFTDSLNGLITLRAFGWEQAMQEKNYRLLDDSQRPFYLLFAVQRWLTLTLDLVVAGIAVLLVIIVVTLRGTISAGYVGVALLNVIMFSQSIKLLMTFWTNLETHIGSILRIKSFTEDISSEDLPSEKGDVPPNWPSRGGIVFDSVSAEYRASEPVIKDISFSIKAGEKVGFCGRTGSGKTSLIMSLFRMIELSSGNKEIFSALNSVGLSSKVKEIAGGLDADVNLLFLSQGQKQLFSLARAILRPGNILVLDEATSNVDGKTDQIIQRVIRKKFSNHTILSVAHKLDTILDYDQVIVLDSGCVIESGNPYALLASNTSYFGKLYAKSTEDQE